MFQLKHHWAEVKYLDAIQNRHGKFFSYVIMLFLNIPRHLPRKLSHADVSEKGCISIQYIFKYLCKYSKYSALNSFMLNA